MIVCSAEDLREGGVTEKLLSRVTGRFEAERARYGRLRSYYMGRTAIEGRRRAPGLPNNRVSHPFARYIVTVTAGYLAGEPISYRADEEDRRGLDEVLRAYRACAVNSVDIENARNAAIYGRAVELVSVPEGESLPRVYALPPESAFVVYADDIAHAPLFGVYLSRDGESERVITADRQEIRFWEKTGAGFSLQKRQRHFLGGVPMVEYWNDENEKGDFEWVIPLIDAYDSLQSDRLNDKDQFADKLLVLTGCTLETDEEGRPPWLQLRTDKALCLPDSDARAEYLSGEMNESGNEILRASLAGDIHKLSMVPDLSDKNFAGNVSGVAMKYKLMGLEQLTGMKQQWFTEGLKARLRLFCGYLALRGGPAPDPDRVTVVYTRSLPDNPRETAETLRAARQAGAVSTRTMIETLHGDWDEDRVEGETRQVMKEMSDNG